MNLILLEAGEVAADGVAVLSDARAKHMLDVLRLTTGQTVRVGMIDGPMGTATITTIHQGAIHMTCALDGAPPPKARVDLLLAVPRPKVMRRLWAQLAALGVGRVILTNAERVEKPYFSTHFLDTKIYRPLLIEGLQQARDTRLPDVTIHTRFKPLIEDELATLSDATVRFVADPSASMAVADAVRAHAVGDPRPRILLAIGPEGGWNAFELQLLAAHGFHSVGMGPRTLRTDTACVALLALLHDALARAA